MSAKTHSADRAGMSATRRPLGARNNLKVSYRIVWQCSGGRKSIAALIRQVAQGA